MDVLANGQKALYIFDGLYIAMDGYYIRYCMYEYLFIGVIWSFIPLIP